VPERHAIVDFFPAVRRSTLRPVIFVKYYDKASTILAADQVSEALRAIGVESHSIYPDRIGEFRDAVMVFIKTSKLHHLLRARWQGNRTVLDVHDTVIFKRGLKNLRFFDGMILRNQRAFDDFHRPDRADVNILLHWDPRFGPNTADPEQLNIGYLGGRRSAYYWGEVPGVGYVDRDFFERARPFNCHLSIRRAPKEYLYKPGVKVSTAGACEAAIITTRDEASLELLGPDYPYYTGHELPEVLETMDKVRDSFGSETWNRALTLTRAARDRTALDVLVQQYLDYFKRLD